jgi:AcrR family transcriptional regulator
MLYCCELEVRAMEQSVGLSRKERERLARRDEIERAARKVFAEKGFAASTLEEIAEAAELAKGTIYLYFENKESLFFSLIEEALEGQARILHEVHEEFPSARERLTEVIRRYVSYLLERRDVFKILLGQSGGLTGSLRNGFRQKYFQAHSQNLAPLVQIIEEGIRAGELKPCSATAMAYAVVGLVHGAMFPLVVSQTEQDEREIVNAITAVLLHGALND